MRLRQRPLKNHWLLGEPLIELADLLEAQIGLGDALQIVADGLPGADWDLLRAMQREAASGRSLSDALEKRCPALPAFCLASLKSAEQDDKLAEGLRGLGSYMAEMGRLGFRNRENRRALYYPAAVLGVATLVAMVLVLVVIPQFEALYSSLGADLPGLTLAVVGVSDFIGDYWLLALPLLAVPFVLRGRLVQSRPFRRFFGRVLMLVPVASRFYTLIACTEIARTLGYCLTTDRTLDESLEAASEAVGKPYVRAVVNEIRERVATGASLTEAIGEQRLLLPQLRTAMIVGERDRQLGRLLLHVADRYAEQCRAASGSARLLQPLSIVVVGCVVALLVIAMYLPIFHLAVVV